MNLGNARNTILKKQTKETIYIYWRKTKQKKKQKKNSWKQTINSQARKGR